MLMIGMSEVTLGLMLGYIECNFREESATAMFALRHVKEGKKEREGRKESVRGDGWVEGGGRWGNDTH